MSAAQVPLRRGGVAFVVALALGYPAVADGSTDATRLPAEQAGLAAGKARFGGLERRCPRGVRVVRGWMRPPVWGLTPVGYGCVLRISSLVPTAAFVCQVVAHEYGHLVGREHSADPADLMFPVSSYRNQPPECAAFVPTHWGPSWR